MAGTSGRTVVLIGGMDRLEWHYIREAESRDIELRVFNRFQARMGSKIGDVQAMILFTNKVSHTARREVIAMAKGVNIPVLMRHSCGVCMFRDCLRCLKCLKCLSNCRRII